jgi:hypothetical protein
VDFAQDLSPLEIEVLRDALRPTPAAVLSETVSTPAWRSKPSWSWFVIAADNRAIPPALEMAETAEMNDECHFNYPAIEPPCNDFASCRSGANDYARRPAQPTLNREKPVKDRAAYRSSTLSEIPATAVNALALSSR